MKTFKNIFTLLFVLAIIACKKKKETEVCSTIEFDRQEMVSHLTSQYIIPAYEAYDNSLATMQNAIDIFLQEPSIAGLNQSRAAWLQAAAFWQNVAFLEFGPAENIGFRGQTNIYPIDTNQIIANKAEGAYNLEIPANYKAKGLQAVDYLLNLPQETDSSIISYYTDSVPNIIYLKEIITDLRANAQKVAEGWTSTSESFIKNTADNAQGSAVSNMVNALSAHYETFVRKGKVGLPVGIFNGFTQTPMPGHVEALYSSESLFLLKKQMQSIQNFINGKGFTTHIEGMGLNNYMDFVNAKKGTQNLSQAINSQIDLILSEIENINTEPLSKAVINQPVACMALYQSMQKLVPMIKVDLTSALGVLITYQDNDGD
ncbi:MAG: imelysin family protein [Crocinitomicaceae bacterium]